MSERAILMPPEPRAPRTLPVAANTDLTPMQMVSLAVSQNVDPDRLKQLMELQERWEAGEARKAFNEAFAAFKSEAVKIIKGTEIKDGPLKGKFHANLFDVVAGTTPFLSKHALAISWRLSKDEPTWMEVTCTLRHAMGHSESVSMGGAPDSGPGRNAIQARGSTKSYLERYTATAILGLAAQDADNDGNTIKVKVEPEPAGFSEWADNLEAIVANGSEAFNAAWAKADPKFRRYTVKFEEEWFNGLKKKAAAVQS